MVWQGIKNEIMRIEASLVGYRECRGIFRVTGGNGTPLPGVRVDYRIGDSEWISCGHTHDPLQGQEQNFSQHPPVFCRIGKPVAWRFSKPGYAERTVIRHMTDREFVPSVDTVELQPLEREATIAEISVPCNSWVSLQRKSY